VALCPEDAITHEKVDMRNFIEIKEPVTFETDKFMQFIRERRSHRVFKNKEVAREDLEKLIDACRYAPTGSNAQTVEIMVVRNDEKRQKLSDLTIDFFAEMGGRMERELEKLKAEGGEPPEDLDMMERTIYYGNLMLMARQVGYDAIFHSAPAVVIFHSPTSATTPKDDCVIASTTMGLAARTMGLETTYIGLFEMASRTYEPMIEELGLPPGNKVFSVLIVGYPKLTFLKTVDRTPVETTWI
jgi:nitroreductase